MNNELVAAIQEADVAAVVRLIKSGEDLNAKDDYGYTALMFAVETNNVEIVRTLLESGADVDATEKFDGYTPLMLATGGGKSEIACLLIAAGANVNVQSMDSRKGYQKEYYGGITPLIQAAQRANVRLVTRLLDAGALIDSQDGAGNTTLMWAIKTLHAQDIASQRETVSLLIIRGARIDLENVHDQTAWILAEYKGDEYIKDMLENLSA